MLDTETTGINKKRGSNVCDGHRVVEIGCIEMVDGVLTGRQFHTYLKPDRVIDPKAVAVHGITDRFLVDKPLFRDVVADFVRFIRGANLVIHNASFDIAFLDQEFKLLDVGLQPVGEVFKVVDTLDMARNLFPGARNGLDDLCRRFNLVGRTGVHGALLDASLLAVIYRIMTYGY